MSSATLLKILKEQRQNVVTAATQLGDAFGSDRVMSSRDRVELEGHFADLDLLDARIERMTRSALADFRAETGDSGMVYTRGGAHSWIIDTIDSRTGNANTSDAKARLRQHESEMKRELRNAELAAESDFARTARAGHWEVERRALSTGVGVGGSFAPPLWVINEWGHLPRAAAPLANLIDIAPLPAGVSVINVPKITAGTGVAIGTLENTGLNDDSGATTSYSTSGVQSIQAKVVLSRQLLDQSGANNNLGVDEVFFGQLADDYAAQVESQLINGTGPANRQLLGLMNVPGVNAITYTSGAPTGPAAQVAIAQAAALITDTRLRAPGSIFMAGRRYFWLSSTEDTATRPLGSLGGNMVDPRGVDAGPFGPLHGLGVYLDGAIPTTLGTGTNQDAIIITRPRDLLVWQTTPRLDVSPQTYGDSMGILLVFRAYIAAITDLYPSATAVVTGTGLTAPVGY